MTGCSRALEDAEKKRAEFFAVSVEIPAEATLPGFMADGTTTGAALGGVSLLGRVAAIRLGPG